MWHFKAEYSCCSAILAVNCAVCAEMCGANLVKRVNLVILKYTICFKLLLCKHDNEYCKCYCGEYQNEKEC